MKHGMLVTVEKVRDGRGRAKKRDNIYLCLFNDLLIVAKKKRFVTECVILYSQK